MEISQSLISELSYYLQLQAEKGDSQAESLLGKLAELKEDESELNELNQQVQFNLPPDYESLGC